MRGLLSNITKNNTQIDSEAKRMNKLISLKSLPMYIVLCIAVLGFGGLFTPGEWYQGLNKAPWSPPNIAFPIVWTVLYGLIALAGWRIALAGHAGLIKLWFVQLFMNAIWSWLFFGQQWVAAALLDILLLTLLVSLMIWRSMNLKLNLVAIMLSPYLLWLCLASSLNLYVLLYN